MEINEFGIPKSDTIEVTTLSAGANGESIVLHLGYGQWAIIDSCRRPNSKQPYALEYLSEIGVDSSQVVLVICTHWHWDHIDGLSTILERCSNAAFSMGLIGNTKDFINRLLFPEDFDLHDRQLVENEFKACMKQLHLRKNFLKHPLYAMTNTILYENMVYGTLVKIVALSPSSLLYEDFDRTLVDKNKQELAEQKKELVDPNLSSIAVSLQVGDKQIILGADMERNDNLKDKGAFCKQNCSSNERYGWCNMFRSNLFYGYLDLNDFCNIKLPHHSSITGFCPKLWNGKKETIASSTLYTKGNRLPKSNMLKTYKGLISEYFLASAHVLDTEVEEGNLLGELMKEVKKPSLSASPGVVCTRMKLGDRKWSHFLSGAACMVDDELIRSYENIEKVMGG